MIKTYNIEVDCAVCAAKMEEAVKKLDGIKDAAISFMMLKMRIEFEDGVDDVKVMKNVLKACRKIERDCVIEV